MNTYQETQRERAQTMQRIREEHERAKKRLERLTPQERAKALANGRWSEEQRAALRRAGVE